MTTLPSIFAPAPSAPALMGIVNITPNSFSDGILSPKPAIAHALALVAAGATILDLGAEASSFFRQGVEPVPPDEQLRRLLPVLHGLVPRLPGEVKISIDTRSAQVAAETLKAGAQIINDISAGTHDPNLLPTVAATRTTTGEPPALILMHISPTYPTTPTADDPDILATVRAYLLERANAALRAGIPPTHLALDPGIGFGKTMPDNWRLALRAGELTPDHSYPLVIGLSRKRFLETPPPSDIPQPFPTHLPTLDRLRGAALSLPNVHARDPLTALITALITYPPHPSSGAPNPLPPARQIHRVHQVTLANTALTMLQPRA